MQRPSCPDHTCYMQAPSCGLRFTSLSHVRGLLLGPVDGCVLGFVFQRWFHSETRGAVYCFSLPLGRRQAPRERTRCSYAASGPCPGLLGTAFLCLWMCSSRTVKVQLDARTRSCWVLSSQPLPFVPPHPKVRGFVCSVLSAEGRANTDQLDTFLL